MLRFCIELGFPDGIPRLVESKDVRNPVDTLFAIRGTKVQYEVQFSRAGVLELLPDDSLLRFTVKVDGKYDGDNLVTTWDEDWTTPDDATGFYTATANFNTTELAAALLSPDADPDNDVPVDTFMGAFAWGLPGSEPTETASFGVQVANLINNESMSTATSAAIRPTSIVELAGLTGGGVTKLDGIPTTSLSVPREFRFYLTGDTVHSYLLVAGTTAEDAPDVIRPDDYAGGTNEKVWISAS